MANKRGRKYRVNYVGAHLKEHWESLKHKASTKTKTITTATST